MSDVSRILSAIEQGDPHAAEQLLPLVYQELRKLAAAKLAQEQPGHTLDATALVHEAYLRLVGDQQFANRRHFFAAAAQAMRRILIDSARRKQLVPRIDIDGLQLAARGDDERLLELHDALDRLATEEPTAARIVDGAGKVVTAPLRAGQKVRVYYNGRTEHRTVERVVVED